MRNFEEEYKNYINEEVPDIWSRIEPQLQDKIVDSQDNTKAQMADNQEKVIDEETDAVTSKVTKRQKATNNNIYIFA